MRALTRKSIVDVTRRKGRTLLAILGILIGVLGLTAVTEATDLLSGAFFYSTDAQAVPNITFLVDRLPASVATTIQHLPNVARMQLRTIYETDWKNAHSRFDEDGHPTIAIDGYADFQHLQVGEFQLTSGRLPRRGQIVMDTSDQLFKPIALGDTVTVDAPDGHEVSLRVVGLARTRGLALWHPPTGAIGYMSSDALQQLTQVPPNTVVNDLPHGTQILIRTHDPNSPRQTYDAIAQVLNSTHLQIVPFESGFQYTSFDADAQLGVVGLLTIIRLLAGLSLLLVCVMIFNTMSTLLTEQFKIIGTMKALGGTRRRIAGSYLLTVGIYSVIGTALGLGLGLLAGYQLAVRLAATVQISVGALSLPVDVGPFSVAPWVLVTSSLVGLLMPLLSALWPLWMGTRITVREAIAAYGVRAGVGTHTSAWGHQLRWVPQTAWLGLRGLFRKPERAALTLLTLTLSGAIFLAVQISNDSLRANVDQLGNLFHSDMRVDLTNGEIVPAGQVLATLQALPNVERVEPIDPVVISIAQRELELNGLSAETHLYWPQVVAGRWLRAHEQGALVINDSAAARLHLEVGEHVIVHMDAQPGLPAQQVSLTIVGIVHDVSEVSGTANPQGRLGETFTTLDTLNRLRHASADAAERLWLRADDHSPQGLRQLKGQLERTLRALGLHDAYVLALQEDLEGVSGVRLIIYLLFDAVGVLVGLVGLLGLALTLAASVLERRLEIGILRSLGATGWRVGTVFCIEGLALAGIAWGVGSVLGLPGGMLILNLLGTFIGPVDVSFHPLFLLTTMLFVMGIACVASFGPALSASRVRIRGTLRYE